MLLLPARCILTFKVTRNDNDLVYGAKEQCRRIWGDGDKGVCLCRYPFTFMSRGWEGSWCTTPSKVGCRISLNGNQDETTIVSTNTKIRISSYLPRRCHSIAQFYVWNMLQPSWIIGKWEMIPFEFISRHFRVHRNGYHTYLSISELDTSAWSGHVIKIVYQHCYQCSVIKVSGHRKYPFDAHEFHKSICPYHRDHHHKREESTIAPKTVKSTTQVPTNTLKQTFVRSFTAAKVRFSSKLTSTTGKLSKDRYVNSTVQASTPSSISGEKSDQKHRHNRSSNDESRSDIKTSQSIALTHILIIIFALIIIISLVIARVTFFIYHKPEWNFQLPSTHLRIIPKIQEKFRYEYSSLQDSKEKNIELKDVDCFFEPLDQSDYNMIYQ